jgi:hypothetical protein
MKDYLKCKAIPAPATPKATVRFPSLLKTTVKRIIVKK